MASICADCPFGRYSGSAGLSNSSECRACPAGRWGQRQGSESLEAGCKICAGGTFSNRSVIMIMVNGLSMECAG